MAQNVNISAIYLGTFAEIDTYEGNLAAENEESLLGTYGSASDPLKQHVVTIDTDSPTQWIDTDQDTGNGTLSYDVGNGPTTVGLDSFITYATVVRFTDGTAVKLDLDLIQTLNGDVFLLAWDDSPVLGTKPIEQVTLGAVSYDAWGGFAQASYDSTAFVCFAPGTHILTPSREVPVQLLSPGDLVETMDHGPQPLVWTGSRTLQFPTASVKQKPVELKPGALGGGLPHRSLVLSPQHRVLLSGRLVEQTTGATEAFAPAHSLSPFRRVRRMSGKRRVTYHALLFDRHEVIFAEGAPVESLFFGRMAVATLSPMQRLEISAASPGSSEFGPKSQLARPTMMPRKLRGWPADSLGAEGCHAVEGGIGPGPVPETTSQ